MRKSHVALTVAAAFGSSAAIDIVENKAEAVAVPVILTGTIAVDPGGAGSSALIISGSTATWSWETTTGVVTAAGLYQDQSQIAPIVPGQISTRNIFNLVIGGGLSASATSYSCVEGSFGGSVFGSICGNYNYGANYVNESSTTWGPGTAFSKTIGGDDVNTGPQQNLVWFDGLDTTFSGSTLVLDNTSNGGDRIITFQVVPVPAAVWLFGSALFGLLGARRVRRSPSHFPN